MSEVEYVLSLVQGHHTNNPDHGIDCSCMDRHIQSIRDITNVNRFSNLDEDDRGMQRRVDYVIRKAIENRP